MEDLGGPFVWYISYLGDSWRVSGCHITLAKAKKNYVSGGKVRDEGGRICTNYK